MEYWISKLWHGTKETLECDVVFWQTCWGVWASLPYATPLWNFDSLSLVEDESLMLEVMLNCWMFDGETVAMGTLLWGEWLIPRIRLGLLFLIPSLISILLHKYFTWLNASKSFKVILNLYFLSALIVWHTKQFFTFHVHFNWMESSLCH